MPWHVRRRLMESNQVGAEVRRIHVIYFLSRKGRIEHPHLIRVHHLSRNGVHLLDVKRWLAELRGKDMSESFAWSYKRRYKSGYVWQDLLDEDLITPISDNEYVLKGSEISSTVTIDSLSEKKYSIQKEEANSGTTSSSNEENQDRHHHQEIKMEEQIKNKSSPEIDKESPTFGSEKSSTLTDDSMRIGDQDQDKISDYQSSKEEIHEESDKIDNPSFSSTLSNKKNKKTSKVTSEEKTSTPSSSASTNQPSFSKSRSYSNGASHLFRNLITCRAVDTNDSATVMINRRDKPTMNGNLSSSNKQNQDSNATKELIQRGEKLGGSQRIFGTNLHQQRQNSGRMSFDGVRASPKNNSEFNNHKKYAAFKPIYGPACSQCGKPFKPEKLHMHMKSCKGKKALAR